MACWGDGVLTRMSRIRSLAFSSSHFWLIQKPPHAWWRRALMLMFSYTEWMGMMPRAFLSSVQSMMPLRMASMGL